MQKYQWRAAAAINLVIKAHAVRFQIMASGRVRSVRNRRLLRLQKK
jgi:hypothetical protein